MNTEERNKEIALMLGAIYSNYAEAWGFGNAKNIGSKMFDGIMYENVVEAQRFEKELKFHSDWKWLMEAVYYLELKLVKPVVISQGMCIINRGYAGESKKPYIRIDKWRMGSKEFDFDYKKEAVFIAISDFAKLYNNKEI